MQYSGALLGICLLATAAPPPVSAQSRSGYEGDLIFEPDETRPPLRRHELSPEQKAEAERELARFAAPTLTRFTGEEEFQRYVAALEAARRGRDGWYASLRPIRFAQVDTQSEVQSDSVEPVCPEDDLNCLPATESGSESIVVTGSRVNPRNPSITNNQMRDVEEGDNVKQIDHFLLVLQDGRIFVIDTGSAGRRLALADRADVYRDPKSDMWYDEMLVFGDRILVTGYSYEEEETELAGFRLGADGRLSREGIFRFSSNDYYSGNNYATRLIGGSLVTYTAIRISDMADSRFQWPIVRRWLAQDDADEEARKNRRGRPLLDAAAIYRPVRTVLDPAVHTVSVCALGEAAAGELECRTTAFVAPYGAQWYVTNDQVYVWGAGSDYYDTNRDDCKGEPSRALRDSQSALLYRVPLSGAAPSLIGAYGMPPDQFAMQADAYRFHALVRMEPENCDEDYEAPSRLAFFTMPLDRFSATFSQAPETAFTALPSIQSPFVASRFTDTHLVYGGLSSYRRGLPDTDDWDDGEKATPWAKRILAEPRQPAYALAITRPSAVRPVDIRHSVIRAERVGDDIVLTGYRDRAGLIVTLIDPRGGARIASQVRLVGRYESEGRSHAFNSQVEPDGSGLMGLPTVRRVSDSGRQYWRSRASDLSFLQLDPEGALVPVGELVRRFDYIEEDSAGDRDDDGVPGYQCEVSCIDWYGNSRPIFTDGRIFGLSGTELIEGRLEQGRMREVQRLNIALAKPLR
jgi:hypothetical protein